MSKARRARNAGSIGRRPDGSYEIRIWVPGPREDDPPKRVSRRAHSKAEAERKLKELQKLAAAPRDAERLRVASRKTFAGYLPAWEAVLRAECADGILREKTVADNLGHVRRYFLPTWEKRLLSSLRASDVAVVSARMDREGLSANTRRLAVLAIKRLLRSAGDDGLVPASLATEITVPRVRDNGVRATPTAEQAKALLAALTADLGQHPAAVLGLLALGSGARRGELCSAEFKQIQDGTWTVSGSVTVAEKILFINPPKNGRARSVPLPSFVLEALAEERRRFPFRRYLAESADRPGEPYHPDAAGAYFRKISTLVGLPANMHGWHALRRFVGTELANKASLDVAAAVLGHVDLQVTRRFYLARRDDRVADGLAAVAGQLGQDLAAM